MRTVLLLFASNIFMTFAWYYHLKYEGWPLWKAILISWLIAGIEYCLAVPANRVGHKAGFSLFQLKIMQEAITLTVFVPFVMLYMKQPFKLDYLWAALCIMAAVYFVFRS